MPDVQVCKIPHIGARGVQQLGGSTEPTSNCESNLEAIAHFWNTNVAQNIASPIGALRISKWGTLDIFIIDGNMLRSLKLNSSHLAALIKRPNVYYYYYYFFNYYYYYYFFFFFFFFLDTTNFIIIIILLLLLYEYYNNIT